MSRSRSGARTGGRRRSEAEWRSQVEAWRTSGRGIEEFCHGRGLSASTFRWWRWRLSSADRVDGGGDSSATLGSERSWIAVDLGAPARAPEATSSRAYELRWPDGLTLLVPADFDRESLVRLLAALEVSSC